MDYSSLQMYLRAKQPASEALFRVTNKESADGITVSPNPFTTGIRVAVTGPKQITSIVLVDLTGKQLEVLSPEDIRSEQTLGSSLRSGLYIPQVNSHQQRKHIFKVFKK